VYLGLLVADVVTFQTFLSVLLCVFVQDEQNEFLYLQFWLQYVSFDRRLLSYVGGAALANVTQTTRC